MGTTLATAEIALTWERRGGSLRWRKKERRAVPWSRTLEGQYTENNSVGRKSQQPHFQQLLKVVANRMSK